jgi:hypothetical protein
VLRNLEERFLKHVDSYFLLTVSTSHIPLSEGKCKAVSAQAMKAYEDMEVVLPSFITSALNGGEWSRSYPGRFNPGYALPDIHETGV